MARLEKVWLILPADDDLAYNWAPYRVFATSEHAVAMLAADQRDSRDAEVNIIDQNEYRVRVSDGFETFTIVAVPIEYQED